jgi:hypothetical protein
VSPILTRPIREQFEHDRVIRQLHARYKRRHEVAINPGPEQNQSVMVGDLAVYPDLLLYSLERGRRLEGTVEVETGESVNQLEALAEWGVFSKLKAPFYLYVPPQSYESARRICDEHQFPVAEIWTYHLGLDQVRFTQAYRSPHAPKPAPAPAASRAAEAKAPARKAAGTPAPSKSVKSTARGARPARPAKPARPARSAKASQVRTARGARTMAASKRPKSATSTRKARPVSKAAAKKRR